MDKDLNISLKCSPFKVEQQFTFFKLSNDMYVIQTVDGECLSGRFLIVECDFDDDDQWMTIEGNSVTNPTREVRILNIEGDNLKVSNPPGFDENTRHYVNISLVVN